MSRGRFRRTLGRMVALLALSGGQAQALRLPIPHQYGRVVIDNASSRARIPPVGFDHWRHRSQFTCRLCHVDIGFAMEAGATRITAASNRDGFHCGACHDGKRVHRGKVVFAACSEARQLDPGGSCARCHARADQARLLADYQQLASRLPRDRFGLIDWEKAEAAWQVKPIDFLEGVSLKRDPLANKRLVTLQSKGDWMSNVLFSHPKHAVWNGCEVCHPEIFPSPGAGTLKYTMLDISAGNYCGACHDKVAFPLADCERCHTRPVR